MSIEYKVLLGIQGNRRYQAQEQIESVSLPLVGILSRSNFTLWFPGNLCFNGGYGPCFHTIGFRVLFVKMLKVKIWLRATCFLNYWYCVSVYKFRKR